MEAEPAVEDDRGRERERDPLPARELKRRRPSRAARPERSERPTTARRSREHAERLVVVHVAAGVRPREAGRRSRSTRPRRRAPRPGRRGSQRTVACCGRQVDGRLDTVELVQPALDRRGARRTAHALEVEPYLRHANSSYPQGVNGGRLRNTMGRSHLRRGVASRCKRATGGFSIVAAVGFDQIAKVYPDGTRAVNSLSLRSPTGSSWSSSGRRAAARRPRCAWSPGSRTSPRACCGSASASSTTCPSRDRDIAMVFQSYALYPHLIGLREHRLRPAAEEAAEGRRSTSACRRRREDARARGPAEAEAAQPLRRPAPARRDGPRDRPRAGGLPDGRAALEPRREAARADARGDLAPPARPRRDDDLRHARPGRGDDDGRPRRRHAQGRAAAGRRPAGRSTTGRSTSSSAASSARRR